MLVSHEATYHSLSPFESVEQLNEATKHHRNAHKLSQTELDVLELLSQYSCKYPGVSYLCKTNIGELIGKHRMTAVRACKRMVKLGVIKQFKVNRATGDRKQTANAIVILPFKKSKYEVSRQVSRAEDRANKSNVTPEMLHQEAKSSIKLKPNNNIKDTGSSPELVEVSLQSSALKNSIPTAIYDALSPFYDADGLYKAYGILLRAKASVGGFIQLEYCSDAYIEVFMNVIRKYKLGQVRNFKGLLYSAWASVTSQIDRQLKREEA